MTKIAEATVWEAYASPGSPLCVAGESTEKHPEGLSVSLYFSKKGRLKGVTVYDGDAAEFVASVGQVPAGEGINDDA